MVANIMVGSVARFLKLYPSAKLTAEPVSNATSFNCLIAGQWINVDKRNLTEPEKFLLSLMSQEDSSKENSREKGFSVSLKLHLTFSHRASSCLCQGLLALGLPIDV